MLPVPAPVAASQPRPLPMPDPEPQQRPGAMPAVAPLTELMPAQPAARWKLFFQQSRHRPPGLETQMFTSKLYRNRQA